LGAQLASIQTKSGWSIFRHMAQLTSITCVKMWGFVSMPVLKT
jgi:hypothetical protein